MQGLGKISLVLTAAVAAAAVAEPALADGPAPSPLRVRTPHYYSWMSPDIQGAWNAGYLGQGATMTFVDDFTSGDKFAGQFTSKVQYMVHGYWTTEEAALIATSAKIKVDSFNTERPIKLASGFNSVNASYGIYAPASSYTDTWVKFARQENSMVNAASQGLAVISKAAGNDAVAVGGTLSDGTTDYFDRALQAASGTAGFSGIFVGALDYNGTTSKPAPLSSYSNYAGSDPNVQNHFLTVGVDYSTTGLAGTSFAAPVITAYAAILSSKFTSATPSQVTNQLLTSARTDTVVNYSASVYGMGEASLSNALAPVSIK